MEFLDRNVLFILFLLAGLVVIYIINNLYPYLKKKRNRELLNTVTSINRGTMSERFLVLQLLKLGIPSQTIFHDLCIKKPNGKYSQIDLVIVTTEGIIVFEVKDFSGWIYGNGNYSHWTKVLAYGKQKHKFYNPIKQNQGHIQSIKEQHPQFKNIPFYSLIVFYGDCELKEINYVPNNTYIVKPRRIPEVLEKIKGENIAAPYTNKRAVVEVMKQAAIEGANPENQHEHIASINDMVGKHRIFD